MVQFILLLRVPVYKYPKLSFYLVITITNSRSRTNSKHARIITQCGDLKKKELAFSLKEVLRLKHLITTCGRIRVRVYKRY